jgi:hypothetical protein
MQLGTDRWQAAGWLGMTLEQLENGIFRKRLQKGLAGEGRSYLYWPNSLRRVASTSPKTSLTLPFAKLTYCTPARFENSSQPSSSNANTFRWPSTPWKKAGFVNEILSGVERPRANSGIGIGGSYECREALSLRSKRRNFALATASIASI